MDLMQVNFMKKLESDAAMNSGGKKVTECGVLQKGHRKHCSRQKQAHFFCLCPRCSPLHQSSVTLTFFFSAQSEPKAITFVLSFLFNFKFMKTPPGVL